MHNIFAQYTNDEHWLIKEHGWAQDIQNIRGSQFSLANGYLGSRGVCEEIPYDASQGFYIAGLYDKTASKVSELVNLPNPVNFHLTLEGGEKVAVVSMDVIDHRRVLNMKKGILARHTIFEDAHKNRYDYQSMRFLSMHDKNIGCMQISFTPLDKDCDVDIHTGIDTAVFNAGGISEGRKQHFRVREVGQEGDAGYLAIDTSEKKYTICYRSGFYYHINGKKIFAQDNTFKLKVKKGESVVFTKVFFVKHYPHQKTLHACKKESFNSFNKIFRGEFSRVLKDHIDAWDKLWHHADVIVGKTANIQQNMRFNIFHMLNCGHFDDGFSSIGARTLSGEGYRGHIFWDSEIFLLPFYLFTMPKMAKNMLLYRYRRLDVSRSLAKEEGYNGAKFAWESGDTGEEETPEWARDIDRTIVKIHTHKWEHHITADVAYAVYKYYVATGDDEFMQDCGLEMIFECARFWASRLVCDRQKRKCGIYGVIGPDEFHINVDNNAFTNMMAKWNLLTAYKLYQDLKKKKPSYKKLTEKIKLTEKEAKDWKLLGATLSVKTNNKGVIEQHTGYFKLKDVPLTRFDENGIPLIPAKIKAKDLGKTKLVKQGDVLMLLTLLDDAYSAKTKQSNYEYYMPRTVHRSSLSAPMHALIASEVGDMSKAYTFFNIGLRADISNLYGNTYEGIHAASLGGTWQAMIFGFAGIKIKKEVLWIDPRMPRTWGCIEFSLMWKGQKIDFHACAQGVKIKVNSKKKKSVQIGVFHKIQNIRPNKQYTFKRPITKRKEEFY